MKPETFNILPLRDLKPHIENAACKCQPRVEETGGGKIIIHNAWDGREFYEEQDDNGEEITFTRNSRQN